MIILEGCDKCGKTSLAAMLAERTRLPVVHFGPPGPDPYAEYLAALRARSYPFIADRFHIGEGVYGPLYRNTTPDLDNYRRVEDELIRRRTLLVLMWDYPEDVRERFRTLGESFAKIDHADHILHRFEECWLASRVAKTRARWTVEPSVQAAIAERIARLAGVA